MCNGIRNGCLISALLFIFVIKILVKQFKNNNDINGLSRFEKKPALVKDNIKIVQHADISALPC